MDQESPKDKPIRYPHEQHTSLGEECEWHVKTNNDDPSPKQQHHAKCCNQREAVNGGVTPV